LKRQPTESRAWGGGNFDPIRWTSFWLSHRMGRTVKGEYGIFMGTLNVWQCSTARKIRLDNECLQQLAMRERERETNGTILLGTPLLYRMLNSVPSADARTYLVTNRPTFSNYSHHRTIIIIQNAGLAIQAVIL
jgi:hypothetical protein